MSHHINLVLAQVEPKVIVVSSKVDERLLRILRAYGMTGFACNTNQAFIFQPFRRKRMAGQPKLKFFQAQTSVGPYPPALVYSTSLAARLRVGDVQTPAARHQFTWCTRECHGRPTSRPRVQSSSHGESELGRRAPSM